MERATYPEDWSQRMEQDHDDYMDRLFSGQEDFDITGQPFCGCEVCERRASWSFLMTRILQGQKDGLVTLSHD